MAPALRIPVSMDMTQFRQNIDDAKSRATQATDFIAKKFLEAKAKSALFDLPRLVAESENAKQITQRAVQAIAKDVGKLTGGVANDALPFSFKAIESSIRSTAAVASTVLIPAAKGLADTWLPIVVRVGMAYVAYKTLAAAIEGSKQVLQDFVDLSEKAEKFNVSPEFYQAFTKALDGTIGDAQALEAALTKVNEATKETGDTMQGVALASSAIGEALRSLYKDNPALGQGFDLFRDARSTDDQIRAVLTSMKELEAAGSRIAALNLGEKMFGAAFVDPIRRSGQGIDELVSKIERARAQATSGQGDFISNADINRAKEINDRLDDAWKTIANNLKPSWIALKDVALEIESAWASIVELLAKASNLLPQASTSGGNVQLDVARRTQTLLESRLRDAGLTSSQRSGLEAQLRAVQSKIAQAEASSVPQPGFPSEEQQNQQFVNREFPFGVPLPRGNPNNDLRTQQAPPKSERDRFDSSADAIEKRTAALEAETAHIDDNTQARERAKVVAELQAVAMQANAAAGKGENVITAEQSARINEVADGYARAAAAIEQSRSPLATFARESQNVSKQLNQFAATSLENVTDSLADVVTGTKSAADAFKSMTQSIINDLARIAIRQAITGPIARGLFGFLPGFDVGGFTGGASPAAIAGVVHGREYVFDAEATQRIGVPALDALRRGARGFRDGGFVGGSLPAPAAGGVGGRDIYVSITSAPVFQAGMTPTDMAAIEARLQDNNQQLRQQVQQDLRSNIRNDADYLTH